ncbi:MAG: hypothetical protein JW395_2879 [Nitrospira sp.]|nr:hypothetical protein [Nitrospira sp.]
MTRFTRLYAEILFAILMLPAVSFAADTTAAGELYVEPPTLISLGFEWSIQGDANRNASALDNYYFKTKYLEKFTVPRVSRDDQQRLAHLARKAMSLREAEATESDIRKLEAQIDALVYACYNLSKEEIETIEAAASW